jgi:hypothetical protein
LRLSHQHTVEDLAEVSTEKLFPPQKRTYDTQLASQTKNGVATFGSTISPAPIRITPAKSSELSNPVFIAISPPYNTIQTNKVTKSQLLHKIFILHSKTN